MEFLPGRSTEDMIKCFGALDTIPYYLSQFSAAENFETNVMNTFLNPSSPLYQDAEIILGMELREPNTYFNIIKSIIDGSTKMSEISSKSRVDITNIPKYLNVLMKLGLIDKIKPVTSPEKERNYLYVLKDNYFRFWLTYVYPFKEEILENPRMHMQYIRGNLPMYMGYVFEEFARRLLPGMVPGFTKIGRWWHKETEIDIVAVNHKRKEILFGECKWKDKVDAEKMMAELMQKAGKVQWNNGRRKERYIIFAKSFRKKFRREGVLLADLEEIGNFLKKH